MHAGTSASSLHSLLGRRRAREISHSAILMSTNFRTAYCSASCEHLSCTRHGDGTPTTSAAAWAPSAGTQRRESQRVSAGDDPPAPTDQVDTRRTEGSNRYADLASHRSSR